MEGSTHLTSNYNTGTNHVPEPPNGRVHVLRVDHFLFLVKRDVPSLTLFPFSLFCLVSCCCYHYTLVMRCVEFCQVV